MIINNYLGMQQVKQWLDRPLSIELLLELQELLTDGTLDKPSDSGRLRTPHDNVRVIDSRDNETIFSPPPADQVRSLLQSLCDFANAQSAAESFIHPLVKASILHFLLGYIHPFVDGNGRTARALFYWYSLRHRYDVFEYLSISEIIRKGYARYPQAYIDTELDDGDLTYFVLYKSTSSSRRSTAWRSISGRRKSGCIAASGCSSGIHISIFGSVYCLST